MSADFTQFFLIGGIVSAAASLYYFTKGKAEREFAQQQRREADNLFDDVQKGTKENLKRTEINRQNAAVLIAYKKRVEKIEEQVTIGFPWAADIIAEANAAALEKTAFILEHKSHPALKAAETVRGLKASFRRTQREHLIATSQLEMYEALFPWLTEFKEVPPEIVQTNKKKETDDPATKWLAPVEQDKPAQERFQLALERYWRRNKSNWEIGRDYERYVGYLYEVDGYAVDYVGAVQGFEDMGRDVVASKEEVTYIVQCKYWSKSKTIHEKHIFQLYGTTISYCIDQEPDKEFSASVFYDKNRKIIPLFITYTKLSEIARRVAKALEVEVIENKGMEEFPSIKCHVSRRSKEKIYHLPFDQQYDRIKMRMDNGDRYVKTVAEAESLGFRRAFRWRGNKS